LVKQRENKAVYTKWGAYFFVKSYGRIFAVLNSMTKCFVLKNGQASQIYNKLKKIKEILSYLKRNIF